MKKIFKGLAIAVAATAATAGIAVAATGCSTGKNGTYYGEYHYTSKYGQLYGMAVEVKVENNIITKVTDVTNTDNDYAKSVQVDKDGKAVEWHTVSAGWLDYYVMMWGFGQPQGDVEPEYEDDGYGGQKLTADSIQKIEALMSPDVYGWANSDADNWTSHENWLLQQYVGWSVADILDIDVFYGSTGEPYGTKGGYNAELASSGLVITNATQGSGRLMLAVQNALKK